MQLSDADRRALVHLLSDRLPQWGSRANVARDAGLADVQLTGSPKSVWGDLVDEAVAIQALPALLAAAARAAGGDAQLAAMADQAESGTLDVPEVADPRSWVRGAAIAMAVVAALGAGALVLDFVIPAGPAGPGAAGATAEGLAPGLEPQVVAAPVVAAPPAVAEPPAVVDPSRAADPAAAPAPDPAGEPDAAEPVVADAGAAAPPTTVVPPAAVVPPATVAPITTTGPCATPAGQVVGFAYVGKVSPGAAGGVWTVPRGLNVRADYPRRGNNWNARTAVRCVLPRGAQVRLEKAPVAVDGDAYWVPIVGGSVRGP